MSWNDAWNIQKTVLQLIIYMYIYHLMGGLDVFFRINNIVYERHKLDIAIKDADVSIVNQKSLIKYSHHELTEIKQLFISDGREVPTQIKISYSPNTGKFETKFSYEKYKYRNDDLFISDEEVANEWFEELNNLSV
jgi:hypothetical protein